MDNNSNLLRILLIEDNPGDARLIQELLKEASGMTVQLEMVGHLKAGIEHIERGGIDIILTDLGLPDSKGLETFIDLHQHAGDIPVIVLSGLDDADTAVKAVQKGAQDYLVKGSFSSSALSRCIRYAIERQALLMQLEKSLKEIKVLRGMLPICSYCKKIRDDKGYWQQMETYISGHSDALFSHGMCPECEIKVYRDLEKYIKT
jgi:DNA-binding NtrC family response regulator